MYLHKTVIFMVLLLSSSNVSGQDGAGSLISPGDLSSVHEKYDGITNCTKCHELGRGVPDSKCLDCHDKLAERIRNRQGLHARYTEPCISCHDEHKGRNFKIISLSKDKFKHDDTGYQLKDKHADVACIKCHKKDGVYTGLSVDCISCHADKHKGQLDRDCGRCHDFTGWNSLAKFKHDTDSKYILTGRHIDVKCGKCHANNRFRIEKFEECIICHKDPHKGKPLCKECHTTDGWKKVKIDHSKTNYPLTNKHQDAGCYKCHKNNQLKGIPFATCNSTACHSDPHKGQFADRKCEECHDTKGWKPSSFNHNAVEYAGFKLDGKHTDTACEKCHAQGRFKPLNYKTCDTSDCHKDTHKGQFAGKNCEGCHTVNGWKPSSFNHNALEYAGFKLDGKHTDTFCEKCHVQGRFKPLNFKTCDTSDCHKDPHKGQFSGRRCESCHTTKGWKPSGFNHNVPDYKGFKLDGKHVNVTCEKCHAEGRYKPVAADCFNCHEKDDVHKKELGRICEKCHNTTDWKKSTLDHNKQTVFPLTGKHVGTGCEKCHPEKRYKLTGYKCVDCHKDIHKGKFKEECSACHTPQDWEPRKFEHEKRTGFGLKGVHNDILCVNCHKTKGEYEKVGRYCNQCHVDPHFNQFGPVACSQCHSERSWIPTLFSHSKTGYPLAGRHRTAECGDCHKNRIYRNTTAACVGCHLSDYSSAPNHLTKGYGQDCTRCHDSTTTAWTFNHAKATGGAGCANCHLSMAPASHSSNNFGSSCENCHKYPTWTFNHTTLTSSCNICHSAKYPATHQIYNNRFGTTCQSCHKYPSWPTTTFNHTFSSFPANHEGYSWCSDCHPAQNYGNKGGCLETCHSNLNGKSHEGAVRTANSQCLSVGCHPTGKEP